jgi:type IV pilus assembly protein PilE
MELMVVVGVMACLAGIAIPAYQKTVVASNRSSAQGDLQAMAAGMAAYRTQNFTYKDAALTDVFKNKSGAPYDYAFSTGATNTAGQTFTLYATPKSGTRQVGDGALGIDQAGNRCWNKASDSSCTPGDSSQLWK